MMSEEMPQAEAPVSEPVVELPVDPAPAPQYGIEETKQVVDLALVATKVLREVLADGKISLIEMLSFLKLRSAVGPAIDGIGKVPAELKDLSSEEARELTAHVMAQLKVDDVRAAEIAAASLETAASVFKLVKAIKA